MNDAACSTLIREAAAWRLLATLLQRPQAGWRESVERLSGEIEDPDLRAAAALAAGGDEAMYLALIGPGGAASPRAAGYRGLEDPGEILADIGAFHRAFAWRAPADDPPDHARVLADFVSYLKLKQAYAVARGDIEAASLVEEACAHFLRDHVARMAQGFAERLAPAAGTHLAAAAAILEHMAGCAEGPAPVTPDDPDAPVCGLADRCGGHGVSDPAEIFDPSWPGS
jgi:hypothetical protein